MTEELLPVSDRARELVRGAYDMHVHIAPDVVGRRSTTCRSPGASPSSGSAASSSSRTTRRRPSAPRSCAPPCPASTSSAPIALNRAVGGMNAGRGRDRRARRRSHRLAPDRRLGERERRGDAVPARREGAGLDGAPARAARRGRRDRAGPGRRRATAPSLPETREVLADDRAARARARDRPPLARRDLRRRRGGARGGRARDRDHAPGLPVAETSRSTIRPRSPTRARCSSAASRRRTPARSTWEQHVRRDPRDGRRALRALDRSRPAVNPPVEDGLGADGRQAARRRVRRGGGAHDGGREHPAARGGRAHERGCW